MGRGFSSSRLPSFSLMNPSPQGDGTRINISIAAGDRAFSCFGVATVNLRLTLPGREDFALPTSEGEPS
jgi:hypothetical protein